MEINKNHLTEEQIQVTQFCGTEPPFSGELLDEKRNGYYKCAVCSELLFDSSTKYDSRSGWPSFFDAIEEKIETKKDSSLGMVRIEILCKNCLSHLGHIFPDGPKPTGNRYCVNDDNKVPTKAINRPRVAAKSSTTIAIKGPSVDSFSRLMTLFLLS